MRSPEIYWRMFKNFLSNPEVSFNEDLEIDWVKIEQRKLKFARLYECFSYACLIRNYLECDLQIKPSTIHFKAVEDRKNLWHIWVVVEGKIIDIQHFRNRYHYLYPLGIENQKYESLYREYVESGEFDWD